MQIITGQVLGITSLWVYIGETMRSVKVEGLAWNTTRAKMVPPLLKKLTDSTAGADARVQYRDSGKDFGGLLTTQELKQAYGFGAYMCTPYDKRYK
jgi:hypothetical protein